jgi:hypothetical protein
MRADCGLSGGSWHRATCRQWLPCTPPSIWPFAPCIFLRLSVSDERISV